MAYPQYLPRKNGTVVRKKSDLSYGSQNTAFRVVQTHRNGKKLKAVESTNYTGENEPFQVCAQLAEKNPGCKFSFYEF